MIKIDEVALEDAKKAVNLQILSAKQKGTKLDSDDTTETAIETYFARLEADGLAHHGRGSGLIIKERPKP